MSAVLTYRETGLTLVPSEHSGVLAPVIDLDAQRRIRRSASGLDLALDHPTVDLPLEQSVRRHPANARRRPEAPTLATAAVKPGAVKYQYRVPVYAKVIGWSAALVLVIGSAAGLGSLLRPGLYQGQTWTHTVSAGESLWGLAASLESPRALEDVVEDIRGLNPNVDATLHSGQELTLPSD